MPAIPAQPPKFVLKTRAVRLKQHVVPTNVAWSVMGVAQRSIAAFAAALTTISRRSVLRGPAKWPLPVTPTGIVFTSL